MVQAIRCADLGKSYGATKAVERLNLEVEQGTLYALLGPNGAGKTTALNMLTTLSRPDEGSAQVAGFDIIKEADEVRQHIGVTFQETVVDRHLSGRDLLEIHGKLYGLSGKILKQRVAEMVQLIELENEIDARLSTYSGGMKRRLELARSLLTSPQVLFMDEPTTGLDIQNREAIWDYLLNLKQTEGLTIFFSTHYLEEAERLADKVGIIEKGRLVIEGEPDKLAADLGADVVTVSGSGETKNFVAKLQEQPWVSFAVGFPAEKAPAFRAKGKRIHLVEGESEVKPAMLIQIGLQRAASLSLKAIIELAEGSNFQIYDLAIDQPGLKDVFLYHTGRKLRD